MTDQPVIREPISNAEFCRFVQEAAEQRVRADAAQAQIDRLRTALEGLIAEIGPDWPDEWHAGIYEEAVASLASVEEGR